jgi:hypothetical protein
MPVDYRAHAGHLAAMRLLYWRVARANSEAADVSPCLQNRRRRLSDVVAHLGLLP